jgi:AcrR family transcriptional regulator
MENNIATKRAICTAMFSLLKANHLKELRIKEIVAAAEISRQTFYVYFRSKEDVLSYYLEGIYERYVELLMPISDISIKDIVSRFFDVFDENREFIEIVKNNELSGWLIGRFAVYLKGVKIIYGSKYDKKYDRYVESFVSGALVSVLIEWIDIKNEISKMEIIDSMIGVFSGRLINNKYA